MGYKVKNERGETIILADKPFASGGEGEVRKVISPTQYKNNCVKIYFKPKRTPQQEGRIRYMVANPPSKIQSEAFMIGWPTDLITHLNGEFVGFMMPLAFVGSIQLVNLTSTNIRPKLGDDWHRKFSRKNGVVALNSRLKLLKNLAIPIALLHATKKYVLKDFKPQNVLVTHTGKITIVDMDSVQIMEEKRLLYEGTAATPGYVPPEAYKLNSNQLRFLDKSWDNFAFGVVFYQVLFGIHPYSVTPKKMIDDSENSTVYSISQNLFPFGNKKHEIKDYARIHDKFTILPPEIQELFINAFSEKPINRPNAEEWGKTINDTVINMENSIEFQEELKKQQLQKQQLQDYPKTKPNNGIQKLPPKPAEPQYKTQQKPYNYMALSVITLFVCIVNFMIYLLVEEGGKAFFALLSGLLPFVFSLNVSPAYKEGNYKKAVNLSNATLLLSVVFLIIGIAMFFEILEKY